MDPQSHFGIAMLWNQDFKKQWKQIESSVATKIYSYYGERK